MAVSVTREVAASPEAVWAVVSDITRMGEMSPECYECRWDSDDDRGVGATFTGFNRLGEKEWSNRCTVIDWSPGERLQWEVRLLGEARKMFGAEPYARWGFTIESVDGGSRVTQTTTDLRNEELMQVALQFLPEIPDRAEHNRETMMVTLDALAQIAEGEE